jgi:hypothetical protein
MKTTANTFRVFVLLAVVPALLACGILGTPPTPTPPASAPAAALPTLTPAPVVLAVAVDAPALARCVRFGETWWLRSGPSTDARPLAVLAGGDSVSVLEPGAWARVSVLTGAAAGMEGWINSAGLEGCAE